MEEQKSIIDPKYYLMLMCENMGLDSETKAVLNKLIKLPDSQYSTVIEKKKMTEYTDASISFVKVQCDARLLSLTPGALKLFTFMAIYAAKTLLFAFSSTSDASKVLDMSRPSIIKYLGELTSNGFIKELRAGENSPYIYALNGDLVSKSKHSSFYKSELKGYCFPATVELRKDKSIGKYYAFCSFDAAGALD